MTQARHFDFDKILEQRRKQQEPILIKVFGEKVELPGTLSAALATKVQELQTKGQGNFTLTDIMSLAHLMFSKERVDKWADKGAGVLELAEVIGWTMEQYGLRAKGASV